MTQPGLHLAESQIGHGPKSPTKHLGKSAGGDCDIEGKIVTFITLPRAHTI